MKYSKPKPHIMVLGLRGFPGVQGGIETHAEHLYPAIVDLGFRVTALTRKPYLTPDHPYRWNGITFTKLWAPRSRSLETIIHSLLGVMKAAVIRPDILHVHGIGPALVTPLARLAGLRVVVTHHGPDYDRQKWGRAAKFVLRLGEALGMRFANERIVISEVIRKLVQRKHQVGSALIPNGVALPAPPTSVEALLAHGLQPGKYVLLVGRLVPEKRHDDLVQAFVRANVPGWKLAVVGGADHPDAYSNHVEQLCRQTTNVVATGVLRGLALREIYHHAGLFVLPSSHEGLPIALLEALSYGLPVLASDIPANLEVGLPADRYFRLGDVDDLARALASMAARGTTEEERAAVRQWVASRYDWTDIARRTAAVYFGLLGIPEKDIGRHLPALSDAGRG